MRVVVATDARGVGGAEISLGHLVRTAPSVCAVVGVDAAVVGRLGAGRPDLVTRVVGSSAVAQRAALQELRPDVVHVNRQTPWSASAATAAALLLPGVRVVTVDQLPLRTTSLPVWARTRALTLRADSAVAVGTVSARRVEDFYALGRGSVLSVPNGVPPVDPAPHPPTGRVVIGSLGRLDPMKGFDVALHALRAVSAVHLTVHGGGAAGGELAALASRLGVRDRVTWEPWTDDLPAALGGLDAFVLPSRTEGFSLSLVEAMSAGLACIASDVGGAREALEGGRCGLLVPAGDADALAGAFAAVCEPGLRDRLGAAARRRARALYTAEVMAAAYERVWAEVCRRPRRSRLRAERPRP